MVEEIGCEARGVTSAAACMDATTGWRPDIVMPFETLRDSEGRDLCELLKEEPACHDIYVILVFGSEKTASSRGNARGAASGRRPGIPVPVARTPGPFPSRLAISRHGPRSSRGPRKESICLGAHSYRCGHHRSDDLDDSGRKRNGRRDGRAAARRTDRQTVPTVFSATATGTPARC